MEDETPPDHPSGMPSNSVQKHYVCSQKALLCPPQGLQDFTTSLSIKSNSWRPESKSRITPNQWPSVRAVLPLGHLAMSTLFIVPTGGSYWHLVGVARGAAKPPRMHRMAAPQNFVNSTNVRSPVLHSSPFCRVSEARKVLSMTVHSDRSA